MSPTPPADEGRVRSYDPLDRELIDRARLRRLQPLLDAGAHRIAGNLATSMRQPVHVTVGEVEQNSWEEFRSNMEEPTFVASASVVGLSERIVLHLPGATALSLIEVELGGDGETDTDRTGLTDVELSMAALLASAMFSALQSALETVLEVTLTTVLRHRSAHYVKMGRPGETCVRVDMSVTVGEGRARTISFYFPATAVRTMITTIERMESQDVDDADVTSQHVEQRLLSVPVEVSLAYPTVRISAADLISLEVGEVVPLDRARDDNGHLDIVVGRARIGRGVIVKQDGRRCTCSVTNWERRSNP